MENQGFWGLLGALIAVLLLLLFQIILIKAARGRANGKRKVTFWDLIITSDDENYSISRFQMYLWTMIVVIGYVAVFLAIRKFPDIPDNLYLLMGVNLASSVTSTAIALRDGGNAAAPQPDPPDFVKDVFFEKNKISLDLPRTQMFVWTIVSLCFFVITLIQTFAKGSPSLPAIPTGLVVLMGISHGAYIGTKATEKKNP